jgi:hypothetical protein
MKDQITLKTVSIAAKAFVLIIVINYLANLIVK